MNSFDWAVGYFEDGSRTDSVAGSDFCSAFGSVASYMLAVLAANPVACDPANRLVRWEGHHDSHHVMALAADALEVSRLWSSRGCGDSHVLRYYLESACIGWRRARFDDCSGVG